MSDYCVYIDESGDLGYQRGTRWFVLTAVLVKKENEPSIRQITSKIRTQLNVNEVHFRKIKDFKRRAYITREYNNGKFWIASVVVDTQVYDSAKVGGSLIAYNYLCKILLKQVSEMLSTINQKADIVLSARGTSRDQDLIDYINNKLLPYDKNGINAELFGKIEAKQSAQWDLLQLADVCATSTFLAYEETEYGFTLPCFAIALKQHVFSVDGKPVGHGIVFVHPTKEPTREEIIRHHVCLV